MSLMNITRALIVAATNLHMALMRASLKSYEHAAGAAGVAARAAQRAEEYAAREYRGARKELSEANARYKAEAKALGRTFT